MAKVCNWTLKPLSAKARGFFVFCAFIFDRAIAFLTKVYEPH